MEHVDLHRHVSFSSTQLPTVGWVMPNQPGLMPSTVTAQILLISPAIWMDLDPNIFFSNQLGFRVWVGWLIEFNHEVPWFWGASMRKVMEFRNSNIVIYRFLVIFCIYIYIFIYIYIYIISYSINCPNISGFYLRKKKQQRCWNRVKHTSTSKHLYLHLTLEFPLNDL